MKKLISLAGLLAALGGAAAAERPNIIFILTDDLGWGDLGVFFQNQRRSGGNRASFLTPHLDALAADGARFTQHYSAAPVCAPARASLLAGVTQGHAGVRDNQFDKALEDNHTLATVLRHAGYATAAIGKWGLHGQPTGSAEGARADAPGHPLNRGFDFFYGYLRHVDGHEHYPKEAPYFTGAKRQKNGPVKIWEGRTDVTAGLDKCYTTDLFTARAKQFIVDRTTAEPTRPFFLYLAYDTPHAAQELPTQAYPDGGGLQGGLQWLGTPGHVINTASGKIDSWIHPDYATARSDDDHDPATPDKAWRDVDQRYATAIRRVDDAVGDLVRLLQDLHIDDRTLIVFSSDNGPSDESYLPEDLSPEFFGSFGPFDGIKRDLWEGGMRVPTIARWPGHIPAGRVIAAPSGQWDWLPTLADLAGVPPPARSDGVTLRRLLLGQGERRGVAPLYFEYDVAARTPGYPAFEPNHRNRMRGQMQAIRLGDLLGVRYDTKSATDDFEIYNVVTDPKEARNLAGRPESSGIQQEMKKRVLQVRRPDPSAPRPYDDVLVPAVTPPAEPLRVGLERCSYTGPFPWVPDFAALQPVATDISVPSEAAGAAGDGVLFTGYLQAPVDGEYVFYLTASAGAYFRLHDATVIDADFGYRPGDERTARVRLQAGLHPLRLALISAPAGTAGVRLEWSGPNLARQPIPAGAYLRGATDPATR